MNNINKNENEGFLVGNMFSGSNLDGNYIMSTPLHHAVWALSKFVEVQSDLIYMQALQQDRIQLDADFEKARSSDRIEPYDVTQNIDKQAKN
jgi:hypothetical protein